MCLIGTGLQLRLGRTKEIKTPRSGSFTTLVDIIGVWTEKYIQRRTLVVPTQGKHGVNTAYELHQDVIVLIPSWRPLLINLEQAEQNLKSRHRSEKNRFWHFIDVTVIKNKLKVINYEQIGASLGVYWINKTSQHASFDSLNSPGTPRTWWKLAAHLWHVPKEVAAVFTIIKTLQSVTKVSVESSITLLHRGYGCIIVSKLAHNSSSVVEPFPVRVRGRGSFARD